MTTKEIQMIAAEFEDDSSPCPMFCIVEDDSGHRWICPVSERGSVEASIQAVEEYWRNEDYTKDPPRDLTEVLKLPSWEGEDLTFALPHLEGTPIFGQDEQ